MVRVAGKARAGQSVFNMHLLCASAPPREISTQLYSRPALTFKTRHFAPRLPLCYCPNIGVRPGNRAEKTLKTCRKSSNFARKSLNLARPSRVSYRPGAPISPAPALHRSPCLRRARRTAPSLPDSPRSSMSPNVPQGGWGCDRISTPGRAKIPAPSLQSPFFALSHACPISRGWDMEQVTMDNAQLRIENGLFPARAAILRCRFPTARCRVIVTNFTRTTGSLQEKNSVACSRHALIQSGDPEPIGVSQMCCTTRQAR